MAQTEDDKTPRAGADGRNADGSGRRGSGHSNELAMGVAIVVTVLAVFFGVRYLEDRPVFRGTYELVSDFDRADGLLRGSSVKISGVKVGEVRDVELRQDNSQVRVIMRIRDGVRVPVGSTAVIEGLPALDDVGIAINTGSSAETLEDGDVLSGMQQPSLVERVDTTLTGAQHTFEEVGALVSHTDRELSAVLANMRTASGEAAGLLQSERERLHQTIVDLRSTAGELDAAAAQFNQVAHQGGDSLVTAMNRLNGVMRRLDRTVVSLERSTSSLESVVRHVEAGEGTFGKFVYDASLYTRLDSAALRLDSILAEFQRDPGKYFRHLELIDIF